MMAQQYTITRGGKLVAGRARLAGKVCGPAQFVVGVHNACSIEIDVNGESYYIMLKPSKGLRSLEVDTPIVAIGRLAGDTLTVESHGFHLSGPAVTPGVVEL